MTAVTLAARGLGKRYGERAALSEVSFELRRGELVALVGPNGAGKTTLLSLLAGIGTASAGEVQSAGAVGWVPQQPALYGRLSVAENLRLFARLEGVVDPEAAVAEMLTQTELGERADEEISRLSGGNQQRVNLAIGLLARPAALLLDEPSSSLDPRQRERLWDFVRGLVSAGTTVLYSTHEVAEVERFADRVLVLADGELLFSGPPQELIGSAGLDGGFEQAFLHLLTERGH